MWIWTVKTPETSTSCDQTWLKTSYKLWRSTLKLKTLNTLFYNLQCQDDNVYTFFRSVGVLLTLLVDISFSVLNFTNMTKRLWMSPLTINRPSLSPWRQTVLLTSCSLSICHQPFVKGKMLKFVHTFLYPFDIWYNVLAVNCTTYSDKSIYLSHKLISISWMDSYLNCIKSMPPANR